jgi:hypothetical protein
MIAILKRHPDGLYGLTTKNKSATITITVKTGYGEILHCSVKEIIETEHCMDYSMNDRKCSDAHNSRYNPEAPDYRVRYIRRWKDGGKMYVHASLKNASGDFCRVSQGVDAQVTEVKIIN